MPNDEDLQKIFDNIPGISKIGSEAYLEGALKLKWFYTELLPRLLQEHTDKIEKDENDED